MTSNRRRVVVWSLSALAVLALAYLAVRPAAIDIDAVRVHRATVETTVDEEGRARVRDRFVVTAPVAGRLVRMQWREAESIAAGGVVARIAPMPLDVPSREQAEARVRAAESGVHDAESQRQRADDALAQSRRSSARRDTLEQMGAISREERERSDLALRASQQDAASAAARVAAAQAELDAARSALLAVRDGHADDAASAAVVVRSPVAGRALTVPERSGRVVAVGTPLIELGNVSVLEVHVDVLSTDAVRIVPGMAVRIDGWGGDSSLVGHVRTVEPAAVTKVSALGVEEQRVRVVVDLDDPPTSLGDGYRVDAHIVLWRGDGVLSIPASAAFARDSAWAVYVVVDGRARERRIGIGYRGAGLYEVTGGLQEGDLVVLYPSDRVKDGVRVHVP
jgi:HlyD family secretion protein